MRIELEEVKTLQFPFFAKFDGLPGLLVVGGGGNPLSVEIWIPDEDEAFTRGTENKEAVVKDDGSSCRLSGRIDKRA